jgi:hypothetical protein
MTVLRPIDFTQPTIKQPANQKLELHFLERHMHFLDISLARMSARPAAP